MWSDRKGINLYLLILLWWLQRNQNGGFLAIVYLASLHLCWFFSLSLKEIQAATMANFRCFINQLCKVFFLCSEWGKLSPLLLYYHWIKMFAEVEIKNSTMMTPISEIQESASLHKNISTIMLTNRNIFLREHMLNQNLSPKNYRRGCFALKTIQPFLRLNRKLWLNLLTFSGQVNFPIHKPIHINYAYTLDPIKIVSNYYQLNLCKCSDHKVQVLRI